MAKLVAVCDIFCPVASITAIFAKGRIEKCEFDLATATPAMIILFMTSASFF